MMNAVDEWNRSYLLLSRGADSFYSYGSLPSKYWKKYLYAERFTTLVRAKTPKITLYTRQAKCYLMENSARDFEAYFYLGTKVTLTEGRQGREVKVIESSGASHTFAHPCKEDHLPSSCLPAIQHFNFALAHCSRIESSLASLDNPDQPAFPIIIGRRPTGELTVSNNSMEKENREPEVKMRETALSCRASSVGTRPHSQRSLPREGQRKVSGAATGVEGVHQAVLLPGEVACDHTSFNTAQNKMHKF